MHSLLMAAAPVTTDDLTQQAWIFILYTLGYGLVHWVILYFFLRDKLDGLKWRNEHGAEKAIREALAPFREEMRESHLQLLRSQPASKEAILTYEVSSLKSRLNELEKKVANLPGPPEAS